MRNLPRIVFMLWVSALPLQAQLHLELSPYLWTDTASAGEEHQPTRQELYDWYDRPPLANLFLNLEKGGFTAYAQAELRSDLMADLTFPVFANFQAVHEGEFYLDPNFPQVGYLEYGNETFLFSLGRRKLSWGPGLHHLGLSGTAPYFDHAFLDFRRPARRGEWNYSYAVVTVDNRALREKTGSEDLHYKTLIAHKFSYLWPRIHLSLADYSLIWDRVPDLQEAAPLLHYHGLYQTEQNVMLGLSLDALIHERGRVYMEAIIDDFHLSIEPSKANPGGAGVIVGAEVRIGTGRPNENRLNLAENHTLGDRAFPLEGGILLQWEQVWTSKYLYNRDEEAGKFTNPHYYTWRYVTETVDTFFGAPHGPDRLIETVMLTYDKAPVKLQLRIEYHLIGGHGIEGPYEYPFEPWLEFGTPLSHRWRTSLRAEWFLTPRSRLFGNIIVDTGDESRTQAGVGWQIALF